MAKTLAQNPRITQLVQQAAATLQSATVPAADAEVPSVQASAPVPSPVYMFSGFGAANSSHRRGYLYWPSIDSRKEITPAARREMTKRVKALYANTGITRRAVKGVADLIGFLTPEPLTYDDEWNEAAKKNFMQRAGSAEVFDRAGKLNFFEAQTFLSRETLKCGDILTALTSTSSGGARAAFFESSQIDSPDRDQNMIGWLDGVYQDRNNRHAAYAVLDPESDYASKVIPARDAIYFADLETTGQRRGITALAHAANKIIDIGEVNADVMTAIKGAALLSFIRQTRDGAHKPAARGFAGAIHANPRRPNCPPGQNATADDEAAALAAEPQLNWETITAGGAIPATEPGEELKILHDDRPGPNQLEFQRTLIRDIAWGIGLAPEVLWEISGLNGPATRWVMDQTRKWLRSRQSKLALWCSRYYVYHISKEIKAGRLPMPKDPEWWQVGWIPEADSTIDRGREGQLVIAQLGAGLTTWADWHGQGGGNWKTKIRQRIGEVKFAQAECEAEGISYETVFPRQPGSPQTSADPADPDQVDDDPAPDPTRRRRRNRGVDDDQVEDDPAREE